MYLGLQLIKKSNYVGHLASVTHETAAHQLGETRKDEGSASSTNTASVPTQTTILTHMRDLNAHQKQQLICKFQFAPFLLGKVSLLISSQKLQRSRIEYIWWFLETIN